MKTSKFKIIFAFIVLYLILIGSVLSFYTDTLSNYSKNLESTKNKLSGIEYLKLLHSLNSDTIKMQVTNILDSNTKENIEKIYNFQKENSRFVDITLNNYIKSIENSTMNYNDYFEFFDYINHENYVVGNKSELLFSQEKEKYFLGTLLTHYIPEFYISLGISNNILNELNQKGTISKDKQNIYIEQNKLVYLSSEEIEGIIDLVSEYKNATSLSDLISQINQKLKILEENKEDLKLNIKIMKELVNLSEILNNKNTNLLKFLLEEDKNYLCDQLTYYQYLLIFMVLFITIIFVYFYFIFNSNIKKDKKLEDLNESLLEKIKEEVKISRQKDRHMIEQSRLAQMGEMIAMIAHQWRQPLAAISSTSAGINLKAQLNKLDKDTAIELSTNISQYSQHLSSTIDDFREFFKSNKERRDITYDELIKSVLNIVEISIVNQNINIIKNLNCKSILNTYPNEVKQVILNLIKNSEDVLLEKNIKNPTITIETQCGILTIGDNGGGIAEDIIDKIFNPYFSTKTKKDGTGLGLYMSKTIIEEHCGGKLSVLNDKNGAVFTIELLENHSNDT